MQRHLIHAAPSLLGPCLCRPAIASTSKLPIRRQSNTPTPPDDYQSPLSRSAAAHILAQARFEEEQEAEAASSVSSRAAEARRKDVPWQGEESIEDAVLRMLVDKYKPLRVPGHKRKIQQPSKDPYNLPEDDDDSGLIVTIPWDKKPAETAAEKANRAPYPWEHEFKGPDAKHAGQPQVRTGLMVPSSKSTHSSLGRTSHQGGDRKNAIAARVFRAKDASADYASGSYETAKAKTALGLRGGDNAKNKAAASGGTYRPMPTNIRNWQNMVDERIELAKQQGLFKEVKGRGKPMVKDPDESNPFIKRSEFLMNRIVKRQEAAPPFVELQKELRIELDGFRARLRGSWIRRATRILCLQPITPSVILGVPEFRDSEWEAREAAYHNRSIEDMNLLVRKYNIVAPQTIRMSLLSLDSELRSCFKDCQATITAELERRVQAGLSNVQAANYKVKQGPQGDLEGKTMQEEKAVKETMLSAFRRLVREVIGSGAQK